MNFLFFLFITLKFNYITCLKLNQTILIEIYQYTEDSKIIDLHAQNIDSIEASTFNGYTKLEALYLHENKLNKLDSSLFKDLINLKILWLESNNIISFDRNSLSGLKDLEQVCFFNNPISIIFPQSIKDICSSNPKCIITITTACQTATTMAPSIPVATFSSNLN